VYIWIEQLHHVTYPFRIYQQSHIHPLILLSSKLKLLKYYNKNTHKVVRNIIITLLSPWLPYNITWWIIVRLSLRHCSSLSPIYTRSHGSLYKELPNYVVYKRIQLTVILQIALVLQYNHGPSSSFLGKQLGAKHLHCLCNIWFYFPHSSLLLHISLKRKCTYVVHNNSLKNTQSKFCSMMVQ